MNSLLALTKSGFTESQDFRIGDHSMAELRSISQSLCNGTILIVDDDTIMRHAVRSALGRSFLDTAIITATDGYEALDIMDVMVPSVVILDMILPGLNGYEVLQTLQMRGIKVPILILSAYVKASNFSRPDLLESFDLSFLVKPFRIHELVVEVQKALVRGLSRQRSTLRDTSLATFVG